ncbi:MAG: hypothetical protein HY650_07120 [Acidobacteria bacterium]|nr:hypothetical protein [Acidobacteriota bacterium]
MKASGMVAVLSAISVLLGTIESPNANQLPPAKGAPRVGEKAPDFILPDLNGKPVRLYEILAAPAGPKARKPAVSVLLVFYRGYW